MARLVAIGVIVGLTGCGRIRFDSGGDGGSGGLNMQLEGGATDCPNVGDVCADGTVYAGLSPDGNVRMFTEATSSSGGPWSFGTGSAPVTAVLTGMSDTVTGESNTAQLALGGTWQDADSGAAGIQPHNAANRCANLTANGQDDWYLPALDELRVLAANQVAIGTFLPGEHWSSNEDPIRPNDCAKAIDFPSGVEISFRAKFDYRRTRCVRK